MTRTVILIAAVIALLPGCAPDRSDEIARLNAEVTRLRGIAGPPPASLDSLYPPIASAPVWKLAMFDMSMPFTASMIKTGAGDTAGARKYFERFRAAYLKASGLVPEWTERFPVAPVDELGAALGSGDPARVMAAAQKVGAACHDCHVVQMPKVQQAKAWDDFSTISVTDPASSRDMSFAEFMMALDAAFTGIGVGLEEGSMDAARASFEAFDRSIGALRESCAACHDTERAYFVDKSVQASIDALGLALKAPAPDPGLIGGLMTKIGQENCGKCHLVHVPAAYTQSRLRAWDGPEAGSAHAE